MGLYKDNVPSPQPKLPWFAIKTPFSGKNICGFSISSLHPETKRKPTSMTIILRKSFVCMIYLDELCVRNKFL